MDVYKLPVHPAANVFPMLDKQELEDLAADIKQNGLQHPVVIGEVNGTEMLIDGRNRLAACKIAGVKPETRRLENGDPVDLIRSLNLMRRDLKKSQQAMILALMYPEGQQGKKSALPENSGCSADYIRMARLVIKYAPEMVDGIVNGAPLDTAYAEAKARKEDAETRQERMDDLKVKAPDIYDLVFEERMELSEAEAAYDRRVQEAHAPRKGQVESICNSLGMAVNGAQSLAASKSFEEFLEWIHDEDVTIELRNKFPDGKQSLVKLKARFEQGVSQINKLIEKLESKS